MYDSFSFLILEVIMRQWRTTVLLQMSLDRCSCEVVVFVVYSSSQARFDVKAFNKKKIKESTKFNKSVTSPLLVGNFRLAFHSNEKKKKH